VGKLKFDENRGLPPCAEERLNRDFSSETIRKWTEKQIESRILNSMAFDLLKAQIESTKVSKYNSISALNNLIES
jgi:hypothetical protein